MVANLIEGHIVLSPEEAVLVIYPGMESACPRPPQSLNDFDLWSAEHGRKYNFFPSSFASENLVSRAIPPRASPLILNARSKFGAFSSSTLLLLYTSVAASICTNNRHRVSPEFIGSRSYLLPMAFIAESPPAQGQKSSWWHE